MNSTYCLPSPAGSILVTINSHGCVRRCDDWEQLSHNSMPKEGETHHGAVAQYFQRGMGGLYFVKPGFYSAAQMIGSQDQDEE